ASTVQALSAALGEVSTATEEANPRAAADAVAEATAVGEEIVQLFVQMRSLIRDGKLVTAPVRIARVVQRVGRLACYARDRAQLRVGELPDLEVAISEPLLLHVLANLVRNAAAASPPDRWIDLEVSTAPDSVIISVIDDGPGIAPEIAADMFDATGTGASSTLAIAAYVVQLHGGRLAYRRAPERGACFTITLPRRA
ncbi:MAG: ATP-binding protein, partial [Deltaproteobacteria bacterium]|nr:ATP-binding protein [Deltaproteobacteria bacterium]